MTFRLSPEAQQPRTCDPLLKERIGSTAVTLEKMLVTFRLLNSIAHWNDILTYLNDILNTLNDDISTF